MAKYTASYTDCYGTEATTIHNDGKLLRMRVRGVRFEGPDFDCFTPLEGTPEEALDSFSLTRSSPAGFGSLCDCQLRWKMPIPLATPVGHEVAALHCELKLGKPTPNGGISEEPLDLKLETSLGEVTSERAEGDFERQLLELQVALPEKVTMRACITCQFSDYSPLGNGLFGDMYCFRNLKTEYEYTDKQAFFELLRKAEPDVQETYLCDEFERRKPGTGYRG